MKKTLTLYKKSGETPLETIKRFKLDHPEYVDTRMTYAGRLDPLADGLLLVLTGAECKNKSRYLKFNKTYLLTILCGISTDTYDLLGVVKGILPQKLASKVELNSVIKQNTGKFRQPYPPYSSKPVHGKPLFVWAKEGKLKQIQIPTKNIEIHAIKLLDIRSLPATKLKEQVPQIIHRVTGDFRQTLINQSWEKSLKPHLKAQFPLLTLKVSCTTGTYMRSLANKIGKQLKTPALAYKITRTEIGSNKLKPKDYPKAK